MSIVKQIWNKCLGRNDQVSNLAKAAADEIEVLRAQRDAWKEVAEHQYGLLRFKKFGDEDFPVEGALDSWAAGRHPILTANVKLTGGAPGGNNEEPPLDRRPVERRVGGRDEH